MDEAWVAIMVENDCDSCPSKALGLLSKLNNRKVIYEDCDDPNRIMEINLILIDWLKIIFDEVNQITYTVLFIWDQHYTIHYINTILYLNLNS